MKQIYNILCIAALVIAGVMTSGCADQLNDPQQPQKESGTVTLTATVGFDTSTKALTAGGVKTFAAGETIAVFYTNKSCNQVKATYTFTAADLIDGGRRATITVSMTEPKAGGAVKYIYPASMANDDGTVNYAALATQDGTLTSLANNFDLAVYDGTLTGDAALPSGATLLNQLAILELSVKNASGNPVNGDVTKLSVFDGTNVYKISRSAAAGPIYVALRPIGSDKTIHFCASNGTTNYRKSVSGKTLERNNIYPVNLSTTETTGTALEFLTANYTAQDGDILSGILLGKYYINTARTTTDVAAITVTLDGVDINHNYTVTSTAHPGIYCQGNTNLVLAAGSVNHVTACATKYAAGIAIKSSRTLTISGSGSLTATGKGRDDGFGGAGIGGNHNDDAGNVVITGGTITATGGFGGAGIGSGMAWSYDIKCGNISITAGTITATGGFGGAGIGGGNGGSYDSHVTCGTITITPGVTRVTATKGSGSGSFNSIGRGRNTGGTQNCGTITIGGTVYWDGSSYQNDGATYLATSPLVYPAP